MRMRKKVLGQAPKGGEAEGDISSRTVGAWPARVTPGIQVAQAGLWSIQSGLLDTRPELLPSWFKQKRAV